jgi:anti-sigma factor RsiW
MNWKSIIVYIAARLQEKSTRTVLAGLITAIVGHSVLTPDVAIQVDQGVTLLCGILVALFAEKTPGAGSPPSSAAALLFVVMVLVAMAGGVSGCASTQDETPEQKAQDVTNQITVVYTAAKAAAVACTTKVICDDASAEVVGKAFAVADSTVPALVGRI